MSDQNRQRCGVDEDYCVDCGRPDVIQPHCRAIHRALCEARAVAKQQQNHDAYSSLVELLTSQATDLLLEATRSPSATVGVMKELVIGRLKELHEKGALVLAEDTGPTPDSTPPRTLVH